MLTATQKATAQAILNIFETGSVCGEYGNVTLIKGDTGRLTFGRSQTTLGSGNLTKLLQRYCANSGARFARRLQPYLDKFADKAQELDLDNQLHNLLRATADDPVMRDTQDVFFDDEYWAPAIRIAGRLGIITALGTAVVYDGAVHGSWNTIRTLANDQVGDIKQLGEKAWIRAYVRIRHDWLANHSREDLRRTVYRMEAMQRLIEQEFWGLELPLVVRDAEISEVSLHSIPRGCYDGPQPGSRSLALQTPLQRGLDVRLVQLALSDAGANVKADGIFGQTSSRHIRDYQQQQQLPPTGVADQALIAKLIA
jgi:chitosanase